MPAHSILVHDLSSTAAPALLKAQTLSGGLGQPSTTLNDASIVAHEADLTESIPEDVALSLDPSKSLPAQRAPRGQPSPPSSSPRPELPSDLPVDINFWFFILYYYGAYLAVALIWVTCLFNLYRRTSASDPVPRAVSRLIAMREYSQLVASQAGRHDIVPLLLDRRARCGHHHSLL